MNFTNRPLESKRWVRQTKQLEKITSEARYTRIVLPSKPPPDVETDLIDPESLQYHVVEGITDLQSKDSNESMDDEECPVLVSPKHSLMKDGSETLNTDGAMTLERILVRSSHFVKTAQHASWNKDTLRSLFETISNASEAHRGTEANNDFVELVSRLLDSIGGGEKSINDASLISETLLSDTEVESPRRLGYVRIGSALLALIYSDTSIEDKAHRVLSTNTLAKLQHRWVAASYTPEGQEERKNWILRSQPPSLEQDEKWLYYSCFQELCREVLHLNITDVTESELHDFFMALDEKKTGVCSFYRLMGLLEADPNRGSMEKPRPRSSKKEKITASTSKHPIHQGPPWRPPSKKDFGWRMIDEKPQFNFISGREGHWC